MTKLQSESQRFTRFPKHRGMQNIGIGYRDMCHYIREHDVELPVGPGA